MSHEKQLRKREKNRVNKRNIKQKATVKKSFAGSTKKGCSKILGLWPFCAPFEN